MSARTRREFAARQAAREAAARRTQPMRFDVRFKIGNRLGAASRYTLVEIAVCIVDRYSLTETELATIVTLQPGETFTNEDMQIKRVVLK